jgi:GNAT superfamily N-acetyltransferase
MMTLTATDQSSCSPASYSALESLRGGRRVEIRALRPSDRDGLKAAVARISSQSLYRRFFGPKRYFTEKEVAYFVNVDFVTKVALVAVAGDSERPTIIGGGRYIIVEPGVAELAFAIVDQYQGLGLGAALLRHLVAIARRAGLNKLIASVLPDNRAMLTVFEHSGLRIGTRREQGIVHVTLELPQCPETDCPDRPHPERSSTGHCP